MPGQYALAYAPYFAKIVGSAFFERRRQAMPFCIKELRGHVSQAGIVSGRLARIVQQHLRRFLALCHTIVIISTNQHVRHAGIDYQHIKLILIDAGGNIFYFKTLRVY